jgi:hypothetical protein
VRRLKRTKVPLRDLSHMGGSSAGGGVVPRRRHLVGVWWVSPEGRDSPRVCPADRADPPAVGCGCRGPCSSASRPGRSRQLQLSAVAIAGVGVCLLLIRAGCLHGLGPARLLRRWARGAGADTCGTRSADRPSGGAGALDRIGGSCNGYLQTGGSVVMPMGRRASGRHDGGAPDPRRRICPTVYSPYPNSVLSLLGHGRAWPSGS